MGAEGAQRHVKYIFKRKTAASESAHGRKLTPGVLMQNIFTEEFLFCIHRSLRDILSVLWNLYFLIFYIRVETELDARHSDKGVFIGKFSLKVKIGIHGAGGAELFGERFF